MAFHVRDREVDHMVRELATREGLGITEAIRVAVRERLRKAEPSLHEKLEAIRNRIRPLRGPIADDMTEKEFSDWINGADD